MHDRGAICRSPRRPPAARSTSSTIRMRNDHIPGPLMFVWPATRQLDQTEHTLLELFLDAFAGDERTHALQEADRQQDARDATSARKSCRPASATTSGPSGASSASATSARGADERAATWGARAVVRDELVAIAAMPDGSPELVGVQCPGAEPAHRRRGGAWRSSSTRRPRSASAAAASDWLTICTRSARRRIPQVADAEARARGDRGARWREPATSGRQRLARWKLAARRRDHRGEARSDASSSRNRKSAPRGHRRARAAAEAVRDRDEQEALAPLPRRLRRRHRGHRRATAATPTPQFVGEAAADARRPARLQRVEARAAACPLVASTFDSMTSATTGHRPPPRRRSPDQRMYLAVLPALLTRVGVIEDGQPISYEEMSERLRKEILSLNASFSTNAANRPRRARRARRRQRRCRGDARARVDAARRCFAPTGAAKTCRASATSSIRRCAACAA